MTSLVLAFPDVETCQVMAAHMVSLGYGVDTTGVDGVLSCRMRVSKPDLRSTLTCMDVRLEPTVGKSVTFSSDVTANPLNATTHKGS